MHSDEARAVNNSKRGQWRSYLARHVVIGESALPRRRVHTLFYAGVGVAHIERRGKEYVIRFDWTVWYGRRGFGTGFGTTRRREKRVRGSLSSAKAAARREAKRFAASFT